MWVHPPRPSMAFLSADTSSSALKLALSLTVPLVLDWENTHTSATQNPWTRVYSPVQHSLPSQWVTTESPAAGPSHPAAHGNQHQSASFLLSCKTNFQNPVLQLLTQTLVIAVLWEKSLKRKKKNTEWIQLKPIDFIFLELLRQDFMFLFSLPNFVEGLMLTQSNQQGRQKPKKKNETAPQNKSENQPETQTSNTGRE